MSQMDKDLYILLAVVLIIIALQLCLHPEAIPL